MTARGALARLALWAGGAAAVAGGVAALTPPRTGRISYTQPELFVILLLLLGVALAVVAGLRVALGSLLRTRGYPRGGGLADQPWFAAAVVLADTLLLAAALHARHVEPRWLRVERVVLPTPKVSARVRVVLFSDLHSDARFDLDSRVAEAVSAEQGDLVLFAGDSLNRPERLSAFRAALSSITSRGPRLAIRGNWDEWFWYDLDLFGGTGFEEVRAGWRTVQTPGGPLQVGGHGWLDAFRPDEVFATPPEGLRVFAYHSHDYLEEAAARGIDLYLCGDTHGGQIALPGYGALGAIGRFGRRYARGLYGHGQARAYVSPGVGVEDSFPYRLGVRPEISVIDLVPAEP